MTANGGAGDSVLAGTAATRPSGSRAGGGSEPATSGDILERVLDTGIVIAGDIRVNLLDIELLTIKLRLVIVSVDTAREMGIAWWEHDPWLGGKSRENADDRELAEENRWLRERLAAAEGGHGSDRPQLGAPARQHYPWPGDSDRERAGMRERADTDD